MYNIIGRNGFHKSVASNGQQVSSTAQIQIAVANVKSSILCYDGDTAGVNAANRIIDIIFPLLKPGYSMKFIFLPEGMDPDDLLKKRGKK